MRHPQSTSLLISSGNGPAECTQATALVLEHMQQEAEGRGLELDVNTVSAKHGIKSAVVVIHGDGHEAFAQTWCGTIQWRAKSALRPHHKRGNWFVGVFQLAAISSAKVEIAQSDVVCESFRAGGPGGQHQNTTDSAVRATHRVAGATAVAREMRSQHRNKALALQRLQGLMDAQASADQASKRSDQNQLHNSLERGNPIRCFKGHNFCEERCR